MRMRLNQPDWSPETAQALIDSAPKPKNPVLAEQLMGLMFGRAPASAAIMLNAEVKS